MRKAVTKSGMGTLGRMFGMRDSGTQGLGRGDACMGGCGDSGTWGLKHAGTQDRGLGEVRNKRNHFLLRMNIKYNFQRIKGRSLSEGPSEHRQTTLCLCGVFTVGT